jgi:hypothetical protein
MNDTWKRGDPKFVCKCRLCERGREFDRRIKRLSPDSRAYFEALYDALNNAEFDLDWLRHKDRERMEHG